MTSIFPYIPRMAYLLFHRSPKWQDYYSLDQDEIIVGREEGCDIVLLESGVSRRHARIEWTGGQCVLTDFSSNGSWVRFASSPAPVFLRRDSCTLYGEGEIGLGAQPDDFTAPTLAFHVIDEN